MSDAPPISPTPGTEHPGPDAPPVFDPQTVRQHDSFYDRIRKAAFDLREQGHTATLQLIDDLHGEVVRLRAEAPAPKPKAR
jgi:hypothetical protein